jgi:hypothetical protein
VTAEPWRRKESDVTGFSRLFFSFGAGDLRFLAFDLFEVAKGKQKHIAIQEPAVDRYAPMRFCVQNAVLFDRCCFLCSDETKVSELGNTKWLDQAARRGGKVGRLYFRVKRKKARPK